MISDLYARSLGLILFLVKKDIKSLHFSSVRFEIFLSKIFFMNWFLWRKVVLPQTPSSSLIMADSKHSALTLHFSQSSNISVRVSMFSFVILTGK